jgi:hypothetical protein
LNSFVQPVQVGAASDVSRSSLRRPLAMQAAARLRGSAAKAVLMDDARLAAIAQTGDRWSLAALVFCVLNCYQPSETLAC